MAWSDAARAAALEARRRHASFSGKKLRPQSWYHGSTNLSGTMLRRTGGDVIAGKMRMGSFASNSLVDVRIYANSFKKYEQKPAVLYRVTLPVPKTAYNIHATRHGSFADFPRMREAHSVVAKATRLPRAKGRASRGHY